MTRSVLMSCLGPARQARKFGLVRTRTRTVKVLDVPLAEIAEDRLRERSVFWRRGSFRSEVPAPVQARHRILDLATAWVHQRSVDGIRVSQSRRVESSSGVTAIAVALYRHQHPHHHHHHLNQQPSTSSLHPPATIVAALLELSLMA